MKYNKEMFKVFANLHPVEAFELDEKMFMQHMKDKGYDLTIDQVKQIIKEISDETDKKTK